jgi:hypothetical protein
VRAGGAPARGAAQAAASIRRPGRPDGRREEENQVEAGWLQLGQETEAVRPWFLGLSWAELGRTLVEVLGVQRNAAWWRYCCLQGEETLAQTHH